MGFPKMNPAEMLSGMIGVPIMVGYLMHFMIGVIFAAAYVYLFNPKVHINSKFLKGSLFGFAVFIFAPGNDVYNRKDDANANAIG